MRVKLWIFTGDKYNYIELLFSIGFLMTATISPATISSIVDDPTTPEVIDPQIFIDPSSDPGISVGGQNVQDLINGTTDAFGLPDSAFQGLSGATTATQLSATTQDQSNASSNTDWRVKLELAPNSNYLYKAASPGILKPLIATTGVVFPYTPNITINYNADYNSESLTHSNYRINQYKSSYIDDINITAEFTAQDVFEANYLLATIHFFRSMTKMFYGQDSNPKNGTPPPLCFMYGYGGYQFDNMPLGIRTFTYTLPSDVDYIKTTGASAAGTTQPSLGDSITSTSTGVARLATMGLNPGGNAVTTPYPSTPASASVNTTWVPTKIQISITCVPILSRNAVSNKFSLQNYANGNLLLGGNTAGFW